MFFLLLCPNNPLKWISREIQPCKVIKAHKDVTFECNPYYHLDLQKFWIELKIGFVNIFHEVDDGTKQNQQLRSEFREITGDAEPELRRNFSVNWWTIYRYPSTTTTIQELVHKPTLCILCNTGIHPLLQYNVTDNIQRSIHTSCYSQQ